MSDQRVEESVKDVFRLAYQLAEEDLEHNVYDVEEATAHSVYLRDCRQVIERLEAAEAVVEVAEEILHHEDAASEHVFEKDYIERYRKAFDRLRTALEEYREVGR